MEIVSCDFCNTKEHKIICTQTDIVHKTSNDFFQIVECAKCGLNYTNPRPQENEISKFYPKNYSFYQKNLLSELKETFLGFFSNVYVGNVFIIIPYIYKKLKNYVKPKIKYPLKLQKNEYIIDIGCGSGNSLHYWGYKESLKYYRNLTKNIFGIEPNELSREKLKNLDINVYSDISKVNHNQKFDTIRMNWSLEHVHNPSRYFKFFSKHLKDKASKVLICIPNYDGHIYHIDKKNVELPVHLFHFKYKNIYNYCKKYNLKIDYFKTFSYATMYLFSATINKNLIKYGNMSLLEMQKFQKKLSIIDKRNEGNDMMFIIRLDK